MGLLQLRRISWEASSAELLEKVGGQPAGRVLGRMRRWAAGWLGAGSRECWRWLLGWREHISLLFMCCGGL